MLDNRAPATPYAEEEKRREEETDRKVELLMREARLWRVANSAQWVAWGIVQAKVDGMDEALDNAKSSSITPPPANPPVVSPLTAPSDLPSSTVPLPMDNRPEGLVAEAFVSGNELPHDEDDEGDFDYLGYAQERAFFFWGDIVELGLVKREELPTALLDRIKVIDY